LTIMGKTKRKSSPSPKATPPRNSKSTTTKTPKKGNPAVAAVAAATAAATSPRKEPQKAIPKKPDASLEDVQPVVSSDSEQELETVAAPKMLGKTTLELQSITTNDDDKDPTSKAIVTKKGDEITSSTSSSGYSRLFAPYRSLGIVSHKGAFHLLHHQNSGSAMACVAIGERFHLLQCDKLHPIMVSQAAPAAASSKTTTSGKKRTKGLDEISHLISDSSLSLSMVAHGPPQQSRHLSLYQRTRPIATLNVAPRNSKKEWNIVDMLHLGLIQVTIETPGEKYGTKENALLCAVILSSSSSSSEKQQDSKTQGGDGVPIVGDDDDDSDSDDSSDSDAASKGSSSNSESDSDEESTPSSKNECCGQVVMIVATRATLRLHKRILLSNVPTFVPRVAIHPSTYVNKILLGGSSRISNDNNNSNNNHKRQDAMVLVNVKTGKIIHNFTCLPTVPVGSKGKIASSEITALEQSPAVDTIAVGTSQGMVHLVNTRHDRLLFSLRHKSRNDTKGSNNSNTKAVTITSIAFRTDGAALQYGIAPMAVGRSDGNITIWDLTPPKQEDSDEEDGAPLPPPPLGRTILSEMEKVHSPGGVAKLEYFPGEPLLLSTGTHSNSVLMHIFDNPDHSGRLLRQRKGHTSPPQTVRYLHPGAGAGGGILVNAADGTDARACQILSSGGSDRTLRLFSTVRTVLDKEYSQGKGLEKRAKQLGMESKAELLLPRLTAMVTSEARSRDWGDLVTIHEDHAFAYVWSSKRGAQSGPILRQEDWNVSAMKVPPPTMAHATSLALSTCGNYALVGTKGGTIYRYNVQSGNPRGSYPMAEKNTSARGGNRNVAGDINRTVKALEKKMKISNRASNLDQQAIDVVEQVKMEQLRNDKLQLASHAGFAVTGVAVDAVNKTVISVGADAKLILWNFKTHAPHNKSPIQLPAPASKLCHVRDSDLAAIALEDYSVLLLDCSTLTTVRRFGVSGGHACHSGPISDLGFSPDGRTLYTSSLDGTIRVWDVPTNTCVDWLGFKTPPTSLTVSPTGEFLSTTHAGRLGISMWSDRSYYQTVHVDGAQTLTSPARMDDPVPIAETTTGGEDDQDQNDRLRRAVSALASSKSSDATDNEDDTANKGPATAKEAGLITMSGLPPAHWKNLFHLELVKQRNKPKEAPKKPPSAPFFLQWRGSEPLGEAEPTKSIENNQDKDVAAPKNDDEAWNAVWSDDDDGGGSGVPGNPSLETTSTAKRAREELSEQENDDTSHSTKLKIRKVTHYRSHLASLLEECAAQNEPGTPHRFQAISDHIAMLGPSAIDVSLSSLCSGMHDIEDGLPLLHLACLWLLEACQSRERYEAVNAYLHRFLFLHSTLIAGIDDSNSEFLNKKSNDHVDSPVTEEEKEEKNRQNRQRDELLISIAALRKAQQAASGALENKLQHTLCLLRHFSRMV
jgi:U3 small nucleolar RNA-associated protein 21